MDRRTVLLLAAAAVPSGAGVFTGSRAAYAVPVPPVGISVQPLEAGDAAYATLAPATAGDPESIKLILRLQLTNQGSTDFTVSGIEFDFPGATPTKVMQEIDAYLVVKDEDAGTDDGGVFTPGQSKFWSNGTVTVGQSKIFNQVYLPSPAPAWVNVRIFVDGYQSPAEKAYTLVPYKISHRLPIDVADLRPGEVLTVSAEHWANGGAMGNQIYAHDVVVKGWDGTAWTELVPGGDKSKNEDYRGWNVPIRAVADGTVEYSNNGEPDNTSTPDMPDPTPDPTGGNLLWLRHADGTATLYTHLRQGSMTVVDGDKVKAGHILGRMGASGNASFPHIHLEVCRDVVGDFPLRPVQIDDAWLVKQVNCTPWNADAAAWVKAAGRALPHEETLIWPAATRPAWFPPGRAEIVLYDIPAAQYQVAFDRLTASGYRPVHIDAHEVNEGDTRFNVICRPINGVPWAAAHGMDGVEYQQEFDTKKELDYRLTNVTSYLDHGAVRYAAVWEKSPGPVLGAYHGYSIAAHELEFEAFRKAGYHPVNISVVAPGDVVQVTALYYRESYISMDVQSAVDSKGYQQAWEANAKAGRHLTYFSGYQFGGGHRISAIFLEKAAGTGGTAGKHDQPANDLFKLLDKYRYEETGFLTRTLGGYLDGKTVRYGAGWRR